jgi:hypothetical protein
MSMAKIIAGFDDTEADEYRASIGKKDKIKFQAAQDKFKLRGLAVGRSEELMDSLIAKLSGFARYGWNVGHCITGTSMVLTCTRGWIPIVDIKIGEELWSIRHNTGDLFRNRVVDVINNGVKRIRKVIAGGRSI